MINLHPCRWIPKFKYIYSNWKFTNNIQVVRVNLGSRKIIAGSYLDIFSNFDKAIISLYPGRFMFKLIYPRGTFLLKHPWMNQ